MTREFLDDFRRREEMLDALYGGKSARLLHETMQRDTISAVMKSDAIDTIRRFAEDEKMLASIGRLQDSLGEISRSTARFQQALTESGFFDSLKQIDRALAPLKDSALLASLDAQQKALSTATIGSALAELRLMQDNEILQTMRGLSASLNEPFVMRMANDAGLEDDFSGELAGDIEAVEKRTEDGPLKLRDLLRLLEIAFLLYSIAQVALGHGYTPEDRQSADAMSEQVDENTRQLEEIDDKLDRLIADCVTAVETEIFSELPKGFVKYSANVRIEPSGSAKRVARLPKDETVAILSQNGRWYEVKFLDPFDGQLRNGWIWSGSIEHMSGAVDE